MISSGAVSGLELMERAGEGVVAAIGARWREAGAGKAVVLCGPGNNGGDGYVVARLLAARGWRVTVCALGDPSRLPADARENHRRWAELGPVEALGAAPAALAGADLVIDALFGIGLTRALDPATAAAVRAVPATAMRVAVDVPSGRDTDSGAVLGDTAFDADLVVTFHAPKPVHASLDAAGSAVVVADIGLPVAA